MNIVVISTYSRPQLLRQTIGSLLSNSAIGGHHLTVVYNGKLKGEVPIFDDSTIIVGEVGASAARNIGASSIPRYRRQERVMFVDDDIYAVGKWDLKLNLAFLNQEEAIVSGHAHPYNHTVIGETDECIRTDVISTVHMTMPWALWDDVGYFIEPGGAGGSEDVDYCKRATEKGYPLFITRPHCILHCGLTSSNGQPIVGAELVRQRNMELERYYEVEGEVLYQ